jgi:hypothetical protein
MMKFLLSRVLRRSPDKDCGRHAGWCRGTGFMKRDTHHPTARKRVALSKCGKPAWLLKKQTA